MKRLDRKSKKLQQEYLKQDFWEHTLSNGVIIMVSEDGRYYYEPEP